MLVQGSLTNSPANQNRHNVSTNDLPIHLQDLRLEENHDTCVWFQPSLADPVALPSAGGGRPGSGSGTSMALLVRRSRAPELLQEQPVHVVTMQQPRGGHHYPQPPSLAAAAAGSHARHHQDLSQSSGDPAVRQSATVSEVWDAAQQLVDKLDTYLSAQLQCLRGPRGLVVAMRALKRARKLIRLAGGGFDLVVSPQVSCGCGWTGWVPLRRGCSLQ